LYAGSVKVLITQNGGARDDASVDSMEDGAGDSTAALRLSPGEEESCLWQMRCDDTGLAGRVRALLSDP
jgi:hypothetical protein